MMVRKLTPEDCVVYEDALSRYIYESVRNSAYTDSYQRSEARAKCGELRDYLRQGKAVSYGAFDGQELAGFVWAYVYPYREDCQRVYVSILHVAETCRGRSLGKELLLRIEAEARDMGCPTVFLHTEAANDGARRFYDRMGYRLERVQLVKRTADMSFQKIPGGGGDVFPRPVFRLQSLPHFRNREFRPMATDARLARQIGRAAGRSQAV